MSKDAGIRRAKASAVESLLKKKGVTGVGIGRKIVKGKKTGEESIRIYVAKKLPKAKVTPKEMIPAEIDGYRTDVIERKIVLHPGARTKVTTLKPMVDTGTYDPITGGISIGPCRAVGGFIYTGTLGCLVEDRSTGDPMLLSNWHVMCIDTSWSVGDTMAQPARPDTGSCPSDVVGSLQRAVLGGEVDCAVSSITASRANDCKIVDIGKIQGTADAVDDEPVRKRGRTTELTYGFVDDSDLTVSIDYGGTTGWVALTGQIGIEVDPSKSTMIGNSGDSGSVVVNANDEVIGLYFAGTEDGTWGVANPIQSVLDALDVDMCTSSPELTSVVDDSPWTAPIWTDLTQTSPLGDMMTTVWSDRPKLSFHDTNLWEDIGGTGPFGDKNVWDDGTPSKAYDDVKNPGYDTAWEHIPEDPRMPDWGGGFGRPPRQYGGGQRPFALATPHHYQGWEQMQPTPQGGGQRREPGPDVGAQVQELRRQLGQIESQIRNLQGGGGR